MRGWLNVLNRYGNSNQVIWAYTGLSDVLKYFNTINLLNFEQSAQNIYRQLINQKIRIGTQDLRIASIALSVQGIVVTRNKKDFAQVPNLLLEDWSIE